MTVMKKFNLVNEKTNKVLNVLLLSSYKGIMLV